MTRTRMVRQVAIRFDEDLYGALKRDAEANGRTVAQNIRYRLTQALCKEWSGDGRNNTSNPAVVRHVVRIKETTP